jgi:hypothetical protein
MRGRCFERATDGQAGFGGELIPADVVKAGRGQIVTHPAEEMKRGGIIRPFVCLKHSSVFFDCVVDILLQVAYVLLNVAGNLLAKSFGFVLFAAGYPADAFLDFTNSFFRCAFNLIFIHENLHGGRSNLASCMVDQATSQKFVVQVYWFSSLHTGLDSAQTF